MSKKRKPFFKHKLYQSKSVKVNNLAILHIKATVVVRKVVISFVSFLFIGLCSESLNAGEVKRLMPGTSTYFSLLSVAMFSGNAASH